MKTPLALAAVLLVGTAAGAAIASTPDIVRLVAHDGPHHGARADASDEAPFRVADDHRRDRDHDRRDGRSHHDDDEDDDDDRGGGVDGRGGRMPVTGPTDPATPVPDNGLFQDKARPKVEVN